MSGEDDGNDMRPIMMWLSLGGAMVTAFTAWVGEQWRSGRLWEKVEEIAGVNGLAENVEESTAWVSALPWTLIVGMVCAVVLGIIGSRVWLNRRAHRRDVLRDALVTELRPLMPAGWDQDRAARGMRIGWKGARIARIGLNLSGVRFSDQEWRNELVRAVGRFLGPVEPIQWPDPRKKRGLLSPRQPLGILIRPLQEKRLSEDGKDSATTRSEATEVVQAAVRGLVPGAQVEVQQTPDDGPEETPWRISIRYGETTRDLSTSYRGRVEAQVEGRLGTSLRSFWDRQLRVVQLTSVPPLPNLVPWAPAFEKFMLTPAMKAAREGGQIVAPYGTDEQGRVVAWIPGDEQPHGIFVGTTGSGKSVTMVDVAASLLSQGALLTIIDPKARDWIQFLGQPGVLGVATLLEDRLELLRAVMDEVDRRRSVLGLQVMAEEHPGLEIPEHARRPLPKIVVVIDELTIHNDEVRVWWSQLGKAERELWGSTRTQPPMLGWPLKIGQLARALGIHLLIGMQRADAPNLGGDTQLRELVPHVVTMGEVTEISSRMVYGDLRGTSVDVTSPGIGLANGGRYDPDTGERVERPGTPGRFKSWFSGDRLGAEFWDSLPDSLTAKAAQSGIDLAGVTAAARDPQAAVSKLLAQAFPGGYPGRPKFGGFGRADADTAGIAGSVEAGPEGSTPAVPDDDARFIESGPEVDAEGLVWDSTPLRDLEVGDWVQLADDRPFKVVEVVGAVEDEFTGDEVFRLVVRSEEGEEEVDLPPEEAIFAAREGLLTR